MRPGVVLEERGEGPAILFLHGTPTTWDVLRPIANACRGRKTLLAALPGYGPAPAWPGPTTAVAVAEAIERAVLDTGVNRVSVVGFSGGAYHALHLAVRGVLHVERVVVLGAIADPSTEERAGLSATARALRAGQTLAGVPTSRFLSPAFAAAHPDACARVEAWAAATSPANLAIELDALAEAPPLLSRLGRFERPVLARTGALDLATPPSHARALAEHCPRGVVQIVEGRGHALLEEDRDETVRAVVEALG